MDAVSPQYLVSFACCLTDATNMRAYQAPGGVPVEQIAKAAYSACQKGKVSVIPGMFNKVLAFLGELPLPAMESEAKAGSPQ